MKKKPSDLGVKWTKTSDLLPIFAAADRRYGFGTTDEQFADIKEKLSRLPEQPDNFLPYSLAIWPKGFSKENISKLLQWLVDRALEVEGIEVKIDWLIGLSVTIENCALNYADNNDSVEIEPIVVDIKNGRVEFYHETYAIVNTRLGIELLVFLAINPQCLRIINGKGMGNITAPGLLFFGEGRLIPRICFKKGQLYISFI